MPRGKTSKPAPGRTIRVNEGVGMPEFAELNISGWQGTVLETSGSGSKMKVIVEWSDEVMASMPENYRQHCESQGLVSSMACLPAADLQLVDEE